MPSYSSDFFPTIGLTTRPRSVGKGGSRVCAATCHLLEQEIRRNATFYSPLSGFNGNFVATVVRIGCWLLAATGASRAACCCCLAKSAGIINVCFPHHKPKVRTGPQYINVAITTNASSQSAAFQATPRSDHSCFFDTSNQPAKMIITKQNRRVVSLPWSDRIGGDWRDWEAMLRRCVVVACQPASPPSAREARGVNGQWR